jgi:hypothetical protein
MIDGLPLRTAADLTGALQLGEAPRRSGHGNPTPYNQRHEAHDIIARRQMMKETTPSSKKTHRARKTRGASAPSPPAPEAARVSETIRLVV